MVKEWVVTNRLRCILIATIVLFGIGYLLSGLLGGSSGTEKENGDSLSVVVANQYIPTSTLLKPGMAATKVYPKGFVPPGALHGVGDLMDETGTPLFMTNVAVPEGQPLTRTVLAELGKSHGMASMLSTGKVAVSFSVDPVRGVGGWIQPGDIVAIFETTRADGAVISARKNVRLLFSSVKVLAVDQKRLGVASKAENGSEAAGESGGGSNVLTVLLNPMEATRLVEARESGHLSLLLRPQSDDAPWPAGQEKEP